MGITFSNQLMLPSIPSQVQANKHLTQAFIAAMGVGMKSLQTKAILCLHKIITSTILLRAQFVGGWSSPPPANECEQGLMSRCFIMFLREMQNGNENHWQ